MRRIALSAVTAVATGITAVAAAPAARAEEPAGPSRVSIGYDGEPAGDASHFPAVSGDGRVVAFGSHAANIVRQDFNRAFDTFVRDLSTGVSTRVSVATDGTPANAASHGPSLSYDGRFVSFWSAAGNLVPGDTNNAADVFVHDRQTGVTSRVSVATGGAEANGPSRDPQLSADGRWVTFGTTATNLAPGATGAKSKVLLHDRESGVTTEVSVRPDGTSGTADSKLPSISADGRYVGFISADRAIVPSPRYISFNAYVRDLWSGTTVRVNTTSLSSLGYAIPTGGTPVLVSADGRYATFYTSSVMVPEDTNGVADAYRVEVATGAVVRVSVGNDGVQGDKASGLAVNGAPMSADGRYVAFESAATNLVPGDTDGGYDIFVRDTVDGTTTVLSEGPAPNTRSAHFPAISADGGVVVFTTDAPLVAEDTNLANDVFVSPAQAQR